MLYNLSTICTTRSRVRQHDKMECFRKKWQLYATDSRIHASLRKTAIDVIDSVLSSSKHATTFCDCR